MQPNEKNHIEESIETKKIDQDAENKTKTEAKTIAKPPGNQIKNKNSLIVTPSHM